MINRLKKKIYKTDIEFVQDEGDCVIMDMAIFKDKTPELFRKDGSIIKKNIKNLKVYYETTSG